MALGGTPPSAAHMPGGSWDVPFMKHAHLPTPPASPTPAEQLDEPAAPGRTLELHVVEGAAPKAIYSEMNEQYEEDDMNEQIEENMCANRDEQDHRLYEEDSTNEQHDPGQDCGDESTEYFSDSH
ncbi:hypothetical protein PIB30_007895 [Stylosanthes scabra]|uniref:Uncharacterized protein n=1 Tax=Stylosanthes scabra TaxID=79078 RepID=A0ABU6R3M5_9FABA|nr:hypothetical protein [Stylosanthes scabra]